MLGDSPHLQDGLPNGLIGGGESADLCNLIFRQGTAISPHLVDLIPCLHGHVVDVAGLQASSTTCPQNEK